MRALNYWLRRSPNEKTSEKSAIKNRPFYVFCCFHPLSFSNFSTFSVIASRKEPKIIFFNIETYLQLLVEICHLASYIGQCTIYSQAWQHL